MDKEKELTYSELCQELNEQEQKGGHNRKVHIEKLQEQYSIEKIGRGKYIIHDQLTKEESQPVSRLQSFVLR